MNKLKVSKIIRDIEAYLKDLEDHKPLSEQMLKSDKDKQYIVSFLIEQIVNECINLGNHIISSKNLEIPSTTKEVFDFLAKNKIISNPVSEQMKEAVAVRNVIAHRYMNLSIKELMNTANGIAIVRKFMDMVLKKN